MIERIIELSIRNRFLVLIIAAALTVMGIYATLNTPVDAIPDLSENQVIVFTDWMGRSPREIEDQITYPLSRKLQGLAGVKAVRSSSEFNFSMITIIFQDNIDFYFARQRVTERLDQAATFLPAGAVPYLAPDATALGQIFWYTVETSADHPIDPGRLWALNKFYIAPQLNSAQGVADVAVVGGTPLEYQIDVRPEDLRAYGITLGEVFSAVAQSNMPAGGGVVQKNNAEYIVRGVGWIKDKYDIENTVIKEIKGTPIYVKTIANVQLGTQFRRSVYEKDGSEVTGGAVLMRHGENPLAVTEKVKEKIQELQPGLPDGVHIVAAYDRTRLIHGAIHTLSEVMWHEMVIASLAILLILVHVRSVFVICVTLPLSVLFSFLMMWLLRQFGIIDIQANIMSLAGITISIGILVDQAIVMTENATHHLKEHFGDNKVTGDIRELVIQPCRIVGRPIFFSVMIMLLSFIPVFMLSGREGKLFHPLAFTKSFAMLGVALISVTVVPALIPTFLKGHLRSEEENWIVRSFINIYKPLLTWALPRRNLVMWMFAVLLVLAAGMFPLQAVIGQGASETAWRNSFLLVFAAVTSLTVIFTRRWYWQALSLASLVLIGLWAYQFPKIGVAFMPALDEGATLDMPVTVPRASVTQAVDDLKARDALLRGFPEVESVIGKSGRADTPTDPAPLDMVETFVNYRPKELWPKRVLKYSDAAKQMRLALNALEKRGFIMPLQAQDDRDNLIVDASQKTLERFDETMRELALLRYVEFEHELEPLLTRFAIEDVVHRLQAAGEITWPNGGSEQKEIESLTDSLTPKYGRWLVESPALEDVTHLSHDVAQRLAEVGAVKDVVSSLELKQSPLANVASGIEEFFGGERKTLASELFQAVVDERARLWRERVHQVNWELFDRGTESFTWYALEELVKGAEQLGWIVPGERRKEAKRFAEQAVQAQLGKTDDVAAFEPFFAIREELESPFRDDVFFWQRQTGPKGDLVDDEMARVLQVPGWSNIFTQPIINRIEMLSTGVRTDIGVKVFGPDLDTIDQVCKEIEAALTPINGARDVIAAPIMGKGYVQIDIDRERAARYGISVEDIQNEIEVALAGRAVTFTVEKRDRFPVRVRYARANRNDEESIRRLLVSSGGMGSASTSASASPGMGQANSPEAGSMSAASSATVNDHAAAPAHAPKSNPLIPLSAVADVRIVEGPAMIKSENGRLLNYVTLNVRGRDIVGFVDEAQRVVAQKVKLPEGVHIEWSGEFEHQVRAARTLRFVFPAVVVLIFIILYLTYNDLADASLMMLAVPEALAGGIFFMYLFPKIMNGWDAPPMDFSVAVWVGFIACFGMATETGIIMLVYLREAIDKRGGLENIKSLEELRQAVIEGAVHRLRPKLLTEGVAIIAIFPMVFAKGVGGEILAPMALPVLGGLLISDEVVDLFLPVRFYWVRRARWLKMHQPSVKDNESLNTVLPSELVMQKVGA
ncbi:MAG: efflux RND transporter permease subunit [Planctomycetes bacterium]|nr:efflux RND transporter permease subunit [Planctomycetota bacterium]